MIKVAVVILNWNGEHLLKEFLPSVIKYMDWTWGRVFVADNASTDRSLEILAKEFPGVEMLRLEQNYGFAGGYNRAIEKIEAEYILLLNSDVEVTEGWLEPLVRVLDDNPAVMAVQPKIKAYRDKKRFEYAGACGGFIDKLGFPFCRGRILDATEEDTGQYDNNVEVFWCSGAALCIRRAVYLQVGGLDERFFAHMEEIDLCWRIRNLGYSLRVNPESVVYHLGGGSLPMNHPQKLFLNYRNNLLTLYKNLDRKQMKKVMFIRYVLDFMAILFFMLKGEFTNAKTVIMAYNAFRKMKKYYKSSRKDCKKDACIYQGSVVFDYYIRKKKTFSALFK